MALGIGNATGIFKSGDKATIKIAISADKLNIYQSITKFCNFFFLLINAKMKLLHILQYR